MTKVLIAAYEFKHAEYYAREVLRIAPSSWKFVSDDWDIRGCRGMELIVINTPRYQPTFSQKDKYFIILETARACGLNLKEVALP